MNKKVFMLFPLAAIFVLASCGEDSNSNDFEAFVDSIYTSESNMKGYKEHDELLMNDVLLYSKDLDFKIVRGSTIRTFTDVTTKTLSSNGSGTTDYDYEIVTQSYKTIGKTRIEEKNGEKFEQTVDVPSYYLTFVMSNAFLEEGYSLKRDGDNFTLDATVLNKNLDQLFIGQTFTNVEKAEIKVSVENNLLKTFDAYMKSDSGNDIIVNYQYDISDGSENNITKNPVNAKFMLEGGTCQNSTTSVSYQFMVPEGGSVYIADPNKLATNDIFRNGYVLEGWYKNKTMEGDTPVYSERFDFNVDKMDENGITLYAKWVKEIRHTFDIVARLFNENGTPLLDEAGNQMEKVIGSYLVEPGQTFKDTLKYCNKYAGHTFMGTYRDSEGNIWDEEFKHPGGVDSTSVKIYPDYIEGSYVLVSTRDEFLKATTGTKGIYLLNDIDLRGEEISFKTFNNKSFAGNGHKISNFKLNTALELTIGFEEDASNAQFYSIFKTVKNSVIKDVEFKDFTLDIKVSSYSRLKYIYIAPLAVRVENSTISNVKLSGNISINAACEKFDFKIAEGAVYDSLDSSINNVDISGYTFKNNRG